jgi:hypothetical protein
MKKILGEEMGEYIAMECWFNLQSALCNEMIGDSFWWNLCLEGWAKRRGKTLDECRMDFKQWWPKIRQKVEGMMAAKPRRHPSKGSDGFGGGDVQP